MIETNIPYSMLINCVDVIKGGVWSVNAVVCKVKIEVACK